MRRTVRAWLLLTLMLAAVVLTSTWVVRDTPVYAPRPPTGEAYWRTLENEALWYSLPPELLSNVIAEKQEQISDLEYDIGRIQEIQRELWEKVEK